MSEMKENTVLINGKKYSKSSSGIYQDVVTGNYFLKSDDNYYSIRNGITLIRQSTDDMGRLYQEYKEVFGLINGMNYSQENIDKLLYLVLYTATRGKEKYFFRDENQKQEFINSNNLVQGINQPDFYFFNIEMYMDTPKPYRPFNNIYHKAKVEDVLGRAIIAADSKDKEFHKLKASILKKNILMGVDTLSHNILEGKKISFGVEVETVTGRIEESEAKGLNMSAEHDGSLRGPNGEKPMGGEYVTGVLYGDAGFNQLYKICKILNKKCTVDHRAGVHLHLGINWNNEDIVYAYLLGELVEREMFSMLPKSRRNNPYCKKLTPLLLKQIPQLQHSTNDKLEYDMFIDELYNLVFREASGGIESSKSLNRNHQHPKGPKCHWDKTSQRYCWLNFVTAIFNTRDNVNARTIEFRSHGASMNYRKIRNWIKIWVAFTSFVENNKTDIRNGYITSNGKRLELTLENMCTLVYPKTHLELVNYIKERKEVFKTADESIDYPAEAHGEKTIKELILTN